MEHFICFAFDVAEITAVLEKPGVQIVDFNLLQTGVKMVVHGTDLELYTRINTELTDKPAHYFQPDLRSLLTACKAMRTPIAHLKYNVVREGKERPVFTCRITDTADNTTSVEIVNCGEINMAV